RDVMARGGATASLTEDLVNEPLKIDSVTASILLVEQPDGSVRANLRSKGGLDVARVAQSLGGGGHTLAAGARLNGPMPAARETILAAMSAAMAAAQAV